MAHHPIQPVEVDNQGVVRFKKNAIVRHLLDWSSRHGHDLNDLTIMGFSDDDWTQFAQLIGYSVSGAGDLSYMDPGVIREADLMADRLTTGVD